MDKQGISIEYKYKGKTNEVQGISFKKGKHSFKGSDIDRKFSYSKLNTLLNENQHTQQQQQISIPKEVTNSFPENTTSIATDIASAVGGLFSTQASGPDLNEAEYLSEEAKKRKKKKKKQYRPRF